MIIPVNTSQYLTIANDSSSEIVFLFKVILSFRKSIKICLNSFEFSGILILSRSHVISLQLVSSYCVILRHIVTVVYCGLFSVIVGYCLHSTLRNEFE